MATEKVLNFYVGLPILDKVVYNNSYLSNFVKLQFGGDPRRGDPCGRPVILPRKITSPKANDLFPCGKPENRNGFRWATARVAPTRAARNCNLNGDPI